MEKLSIELLESVLSRAKGKKIAVVGDVMLDRFFWGTVSRISPEAPVPVVDVEDESYHLGGAANVANNLKSLGLDPILFGVVGKDASGEKFIEISKELGIDPKGLYIDSNRPTTVKTRIIGNNQHLVRLDRETRDKISKEGFKLIVDTLTNEKDISGIIFGDYDKGTITEELITEITVYARQFNLPVYVDPKFDNFFYYKSATFFKPNRKEAATALGMSITTDDDVLEAGKRLLEQLEPDNLLLTLGSKGMVLFESNGNVSTIPTIARHIADVSGAGDTAIATLAAAIAGGAIVTEAAMLANFASGAVCEIPGVVPITYELLENAIKKSNNLYLNKIVVKT